MKKKFIAAALCLLSGAMAGCGTPPPTQTQLNWAARERTRIKSFMLDVERHIRAGDHEDIMRRFVYAGETAERRRANYTAVKCATWIPELRGYRILDLDRALGRLHWQDLNEGRVVINVDSTCTAGKKHKDRFDLFRPEGDWLISAVRLRSPAAGSPVSLSAEDRESIISMLEPLFEALEKKDSDSLLDMLPATFEARYREERSGFFRWPPWRRRRAAPFEEDLRHALELDIEKWPEPAEGFPARYAGNMSAFLSYSLKVRPDGDPARTETLSLLVYAVEDEAREWNLRKIRFRGRRFPR